MIDDSSILELNQSLVESNIAHRTIGALHISSNSLLVALNSTFKGNRAYQDSTIGVENSTVYLEKCTFMDNQMTATIGGVLSVMASELKLSHTVFTHNVGYFFYFYKYQAHFTSKFYTYRSLYRHENISLKSSLKPTLTPSDVVTRETPYASSKFFLFCLKMVQNSLFFSLRSSALWSSIQYKYTNPFPTNLLAGPSWHHELHSGFIVIKPLLLNSLSINV